MLLPMMTFWKKLLLTVPGTRQLFGPNPPTRIGPLAHTNPSALSNEIKKWKPTGKATCQKMGFIELEVIL
jgi:hypothetical protein